MKIKGITLPDWLGEDAQRRMRKIISKLKDEGRLDSFDEEILSSLASNIELSNRYLEATMKAKDLTWETPAGSLNIIPEAREYRQLQVLINTQLKEMGLTLASRSKMKRLDPEGEENDLLEQLKNI